jgi:medium-chain acyl-[acyl-carrier-protein] hydrolase
MTATQPSTPWLAFHKPNPQATIRLFCFPYAGGSALIYRHWAAQLPPTVEACMVQLPGRGSRLHETPFKQMKPLVEAIARGLNAYFGKPFALYGHSMGAIISFELARLLRRERGLEPVRLFVSGRGAPQVAEPDPLTYALPEPEFLAELQRLEGTPQEVLEHPELMQAMLPLIRADFEAIQTYVYQAKPLLSCPISAFGGLQDPSFSREKLEAWRELTTASFSLRMFPGNHFFINSDQRLVVSAIVKELSQFDCPGRELYPRHESECQKVRSQADDEKKHRTERVENSEARLEV